MVSGTALTAPLSLKLKAKDMPKLTKEMPYQRWVGAVEAMLDPQHGVRYLGALTDAIMASGLPEEAVKIHVGNDALIYAALLMAVEQHPVLYDKVTRAKQGETWGKAARAWKEVREYFVRYAETQRSKLERELQNFSLKDGEQMDELLNRLENCRTRWQLYGLVLDDEKLIRRVKELLDYGWQLGSVTTVSGEKVTLLDLDPAKGSWEDVSSALRAEDNRRRGANTSVPNAPLPLGWKHKGQGAARVAEGGSSAPGTSRASSPPPAHAAPAVAAGGGGGGKGKGRGKEQGKPGPSKGKEPEGGAVTKPDPANWTCFACLKKGHGSNECPTKPEGWKWDEEAKERYAKHLKDQKASQKAAKVQHPKV